MSARHWHIHPSSTTSHPSPFNRSFQEMRGQFAFSQPKSTSI